MEAGAIRTSSAQSDAGRFVAGRVTIPSHFARSNSASLTWPDRGARTLKEHFAMRLPYHSWTTTLRRLGLRLTRKRPRRETPPSRQPRVEPLERREVLAADVSFGLANDTGASNTDGITDDPTVAYTIHADEEGGQIYVYIEGNLVFDGWAVEGASGTYTPTNVVEQCGSANYSWINYTETGWDGGDGSVAYCLD